MNDLSVPIIMSMNMANSIKTIYQFKLCFIFMTYVFVGFIGYKIIYFIYDTIYFMFHPCKTNAEYAEDAFKAVISSTNKILDKLNKY